MDIKIVFELFIICWQALVHYVTIAREIPQPDRFFSFLPRGMDTSEPSGPIPMSATTSDIMRWTKDDEIMVSLEYIEQIMDLFCLSSGEIWCIQRCKFDLIFGVRMLNFEFEIHIPGNIFDFVFCVYVLYP